MWPSLYRAVHATPPDTLDALRESFGRPVVLRCTAPRCTQCAAYEGEGDPAGFEARTFSDPVVSWPCVTARHRALASAAGVDELPAYIQLSATPPRVVRPPGW